MNKNYMEYMESAGLDKALCEDYLVKKHFNSSVKMGSFQIIYRLPNGMGVSAVSGWRGGWWWNMYKWEFAMLEKVSIDGSQWVFFNQDITTGHAPESSFYRCNCFIEANAWLQDTLKDLGEM